jgi:hypothetical protein
MFAAATELHPEPAESSPYHLFFKIILILPSSLCQGFSSAFFPFKVFNQKLFYTFVQFLSPTYMLDV